MSAITTHVLDAVTGTPAAGLTVALETPDELGVWVALDTGTTDADGRCQALGPDILPLGHYRLRFDTGAWFATAGRETFYPEVVITFALVDRERRHHHVPLLLSPFAYSTYRGS